MKTIFKTVALSALMMTAFNSCEKDEGELPEIMFKTGGTYTSADATLPGGTAVTIGIEAEKTEGKDVLKKFDISESVDGGANTSIYNVDLDASQEDMYDYDFNTTMDTVSGQTNKYTFTVTNRDGLTNQVALTLTVQ
ncbi:hypothetical protein K6119_12880 [Paracrocinitomix mangrovi]|uniref:hypothetical protein n=1 Tax=Paracrocinitomix mangrovi TaxID=2862509 RepID=UPI001C8E32EC|nr:hypothetical protein [Paracrocinitomix mangrovi]UKN00623.1 hypothetical protein K6119_12880 [Paracrocinitomix mangrovi]